MKLSIYNNAVKKRGNVLLFNAFTLACVLLSESEYKNFLSFSAPEKESGEFYRLGFYVDDDLNEVDEVQYASRCLTDGDKQQFYRIYTTLGCNAKCPYCYEKGAKAIFMTEKTADAVIEFIKARMVSGSRLTIEWFGGEPLLNEKIIDYITNKIKPICQKKRVRYSSRMVSNGYLFDEQKILKVKDWNLKSVQITIDGLKETYERIKGFGKKDAFERVINNIELLLQNDVRVSIRLNYDEENFEELKKLIEYLGERFSKYENATVYGRRIMGDDIDNSFVASQDTDIELLKVLRKNNFNKDILSTIMRRDNTCIANMLHAFMILPNGDLGKCSQAISKGDIVGSVFDKIDEKKIIKWCTPRLEEKCLKCKLLPLCNGGCIYEKLMNKNYCFASKNMLMFKLRCELNEQLKKR